MYKSKLVMYPYGREIAGVSDFWLMRNEEIRYGNSKNIERDFGIGYVGKEELYIVPYSRHSKLVVDHVVLMDSDVETYRSYKDPYPYGMHRVNSGMRVYVFDSWILYFSKLMERGTREFKFGETGIVWDSNVEYDREWYRELDSKVKEYILIGECKEAREVLDRNGRLYIRESVEKRKDVGIEYCVKGELVGELSKRGIETTYDTVRKVIKIYSVPVKGERYSVRYFVEFFNQRGKGLSREESHREALKIC